MRLERRVALLMVLVAVPYLCTAIGLFYYIHGHPGEPVPRWISVPMLFFLILTIYGGGIVVSRCARKWTASETVDEGKLRRARATKGLKIGLFVWGLILLNDLRMLAEGSVPWTIAIPGLAIVSLLILISWISLKRLKKADSPDSGESHISQK